MRLLKHFALGLGLLAAPALQAAPLDGSIDFSGLFRGENASGTNVRLADAVAIDFCASVSGNCVTSPGAGTGTGAFEVLRMQGNLPVAEGAIGTIRDLRFDNFSGPIVDFFTVGALAFALEDLSVTKFSLPAMGPGGRPVDYLLLGGSGTLCASGTDCTNASFTFSGQSDGRNLTGTFSFSGGAAATAVPAPAGLALLGAGLLGLGLIRRRKTAA